MKVPTIEEVLAAGERMAINGTMNRRDQQFYVEDEDLDIILSAEDMLFIDELKTMDIDDFFIEPLNKEPVDLCKGRKLSFEEEMNGNSNRLTNIVH